VTRSALGNLNLNTTAISAVPVQEERWDYDPTGNWRGYQVEADGGITLDQGRVHDKGNRLTQIEDDPYPVLSDRVGRMRQVSPDASGDWEESQQIKWDAWGRITQIKRASDEAVLGSYAYDGLTRRTTRTVGSTAHHCYYSDQWRPLEERQNSQTTADLQYCWGARHRDDLVRRDRATTDGDTLDEIRYVLMDYFSPAAITDETGAVTERYRFSAFGVRSLLAPDFTSRSASECDFTFAFQGQFLDRESGFLNYGYRYYSPSSGRWLSKDPIQEEGGLNIYTFTENSPLNSTDLFGLVCFLSIQCNFSRLVPSRVSWRGPTAVWNCTTCECGTTCGGPPVGSTPIFIIGTPAVGASASCWKSTISVVLPAGTLPGFIPGAIKASDPSGNYKIP
jgi:RHS repeat-associated protein